MCLLVGGGVTLLCFLASNNRFEFTSSLLHTSLSFDTAVFTTCDALEKTVVA